MRLKIHLSKQKKYICQKTKKLLFFNYHRILSKVIVSSSCHCVQLNKVVKVGYFSIHPFLKNRKRYNGSHYIKDTTIANYMLWQCLSARRQHWQVKDTELQEWYEEMEIKNTSTTFKNVSIFRVIQTLRHFPFIPMLLIPLRSYFVLNLHEFHWKPHHEKVAGKIIHAYSEKSSKMSTQYHGLKIEAGLLHVFYSCWNPCHNLINKKPLHPSTSLTVHNEAWWF